MSKELVDKLFSGIPDSEFHGLYAGTQLARQAQEARRLGVTTEEMAKFAEEIKVSATQNGRSFLAECQISENQDGISDQKKFQIQSAKFRHIPPKISFDDLKNLSKDELKRINSTEIGRMTEGVYGPIIALYQVSDQETKSYIEQRVKEELEPKLKELSSTLENEPFFLEEKALLHIAMKDRISSAFINTEAKGMGQQSGDLYQKHANTIVEFLHSALTDEMRSELRKTNIDDISTKPELTLPWLEAMKNDMTEAFRIGSDAQPNASGTFYQTGEKKFKQFADELAMNPKGAVEKHYNSSVQKRSIETILGVIDKEIPLARDTRAMIYEKLKEIPDLNDKELATQKDLTELLKPKQTKIFGIKRKLSLNKDEVEQIRNDLEAKNKIQSKETKVKKEQTSEEIKEEILGGIIQGLNNEVIRDPDLIKALRNKLMALDVLDPLDSIKRIYETKTSNLGGKPGEQRPLNIEKLKSEYISKVTSEIHIGMAAKQKNPGIKIENIVNIATESGVSTIAKTLTTTTDTQYFAKPSPVNSQKPDKGKRPPIPNEPLPDVPVKEQTSEKRPPIPNEPLPDVPVKEQMADVKVKGAYPEYGYDTKYEEPLEMPERQRVSLSSGPSRIKEDVKEGQEEVNSVQEQKVTKDKNLGRLQKDIMSVNAAYENGDSEKFTEIVAALENSGVELIFRTEYVEDIKGNCYKSLALIDREDKEIVIANAGTRPTADQEGLSDIKDDLNLVMHKKPFKIQQAATVNDMIIDSLGENISDFKIHYTGHSLGAAISEIQAADMDIKLRKSGSRTNKDQISTITFENPGTKPILEEMYKEANIDPKAMEEIPMQTFNNRKNVINTLNEQAGEVYTIVPEGQQQKEPGLIQKVFAVIGTYINKISWLGGKICELMSIANSSNIFTELTSDHSIENFDKVFVQKTGSMKSADGKVVPIEEIYTGKKSIEYSESHAASLTALKKEHKDIGKQEYIMQAQRIDGTLRSVTFSAIEASKVISEVKNVVKAAEEQKIGEKKLTFAERIKTQRARKIVDEKQRLPKIGDIAADNKVIVRR